ncbi:DUF305 domain-containing protein [Occultella glacieicola]|uniref:DUF305 domain-containing protein n=1 Tax=Occultella glacieicola TaxID=2518684 RepID=A0ABY2E744_9MICO|nr:DUF305 domain-containing protein [Occultella glacieicola]TDE94131.1 DUF305 domain-containing protein [Occultella glacieicola]
MPRRLVQSAAVLALGLLTGLLAGCTDPSPQTSPSATETATAQASTSPSPEATTATPEPGNEADIDFANAIRVYHAQSSQMHQAILSKAGVPDDVLTLAGTLANVQGRESGDLEALLVTWGEEPVDPATAGIRTGMLTPEELQNLFTGSGSDATVVYLTGMVGHHEATLDLAEQVLTTGSSPEVAAIAEEITSSQPEELDELRALLAATGPTGSESSSG